MDLTLFQGVFLGLLCIVISQDCPVSNECRCVLTDKTVTKIHCSKLLFSSMLPSVPDWEKPVENVIISDSNIASLKDDILEGIQVKELDMSNIGIMNINQKSFSYVDNHVEKLNLSSNKLQRFLELNFGNMAALSDLDLSDNEVTSLDEGVFTRMPRLERLKLNNNSIVTLADKCFFDLVSIKDIDLSYNVLRELGDLTVSALLTLETLDLSHNEINYLSSGSFGSLIKLLSLNLSHNAITSYPHEVFGSMFDLQDLDLSHNRVSLITDAPFDALLGLRSLKISHNRLEFIRSTAFNSLDKLELLDLSNNFLTVLIHSTFDGLINLKTLDLSHNGLVSLHASVFYGMSSLKSLNLRGNGLAKVVYGNLNLLPTLTEVDLSNNRIDEVEYASLDGLSMLRNLNLRRNKLTELPKDLLRDNVQLETLILAGNEIEDSGLVNEFFEHQKNLKVLDLSSNQIPRLVPEWFEGKSILSVLHLGGNPLTSVDQEILEKLTSLEVLGLNGTCITELADDTFSGNSGLKQLYLQNNAFSSISSELFDKLANLEILSLRHNYISSSSSGVFSKNINLKTLLLDDNHLGNNAMKTIVSSATSGVRTIGLSYNRITKVEKQLFTSFQSLTDLHLAMNPFHCDCSLEWLRTFPPYKDYRHSICATPSELENIFLPCFERSSSCGLNPVPADMAHACSVMQDRPTGYAKTDLKYTKNQYCGKLTPQPPAATDPSVDSSTTQQTDLVADISMEVIIDEDKAIVTWSLDSNAPIKSFALVVSQGGAEIARFPVASNARQFTVTGIDRSKIYLICLKALMHDGTKDKSVGEACSTASTQTPPEAASSQVWPIIVGVLLAVLILAAIAAVLVYFYKFRGREKQPEVDEADGRTFGGMTLGQQMGLWLKAFEQQVDTEGNQVIVSKDPGKPGVAVFTVNMASMGDTPAPIPNSKLYKPVEDSSA